MTHVLSKWCWLKMIAGIIIIVAVTSVAVIAAWPTVRTSRITCESLFRQHTWSEINELYTSDTQQYRHLDADRDGLPCEKQRDAER